MSDEYAPKHRKDVPVDACQGLCGSPDCVVVDPSPEWDFKPRHRADVEAVSA